MVINIETDYTIVVLTEYEMRIACQIGKMRSDNAEENDLGDHMDKELWLSPSEVRHRNGAIAECAFAKLTGMLWFAYIDDINKVARKNRPLDVGPCEVRRRSEDWHGILSKVGDKDHTLMVLAMPTGHDNCILFAGWGQMINAEPCKAEKLKGKKELKQSALYQMWKLESRCNELGFEWRKGIRYSVRGEVYHA